MSVSRRGDPRHYQIAVLLALLLWGRLVLGFEVGGAFLAATVGSALALQALLGRALDGARFEPRSALISSLSLCLLLRTSEPWLGACASGLAIGSKFLLRVRGRHLWNPSAFALVAMVLLTERAWISPGQWGSAAWLGLAVACLGTLVVTRAARADVTLAFLLGWTGLLLARAAWLGDPLAVPLHQLRSGSLLIFAFFMISDPRSTPASRPGRVVFGLGVAAAAFVGRFALYEPDALLYALVAAAPLVPWIDRSLPGRAHRWNAPHPVSGGTTHGPANRPVPAAAGHVAPAS